MSGNIGQIAKLTNTGQLESEAIQGTAPLIVASTTLVENLNAEMLNEMTEDSVLRTDRDRELKQGKILTVKGTIKVDETSGSLVVGSFELKETNGIFHINASGN